MANCVVMNVVSVVEKGIPINEAVPQMMIPAARPAARPVTPL